jgi:hypothetical protein
MGGAVERASHLPAHPILQVFIKAGPSILDLTVKNHVM